MDENKIENLERMLSWREKEIDRLRKTNERLWWAFGIAFCIMAVVANLYGNAKDEIAYWKMTPSQRADFDSSQGDGPGDTDRQGARIRP